MFHPQEPQTIGGFRDFAQTWFKGLIWRSDMAPCSLVEAQKMQSSSNVCLGQLIIRQTAIFSPIQNWLGFITQECLLGGTDWVFIHNRDSSKAQWSLYVPHNGHYMYRTVVTICTASLTFNNSTFCPHSWIYVFCVDLRTNSHYYPIQH